MVFHLHTVFGFNWNPYAYILLATFVISHFVKERLTIKN
jgi:hypothetical protein